MRVALQADDPGFQTAITDGICDAIRRGLLTGASVLANAPGTAATLEVWKRLEEDRRDAARRGPARRGRLPRTRRPDRVRPRSRGSSGAAG